MVLKVARYSAYSFSFRSEILHGMEQYHAGEREAIV
jgi:hypothetical protein